MDIEDALQERERLVSLGNYEAAAVLEDTLMALVPRDAEILRKAIWTAGALKDLKRFDQLSRARRSLMAELHQLASGAHLTRIQQALEQVLPRWRHCQDQRAEVWNEDVLLSAFSDDVPNWINDIPLKYEKSDIVDLGAVGRFYVGDSNQVLHKRLARGMIWEPAIAVLLMELAGRCDPEAVIVDMGANIGTMSVPIARAFSGQVLSFEPVPQTFSDLIANLELNNCKNVQARQKACSKATGRGTMIDVLQTNPGMAKLDLDGGDTVVSTLDIELRGQKIALLKMDVEGHEADVLDGGVESLRAHRPLIICEILNGQQSRIYEKISSLGYQGQRFYRSDWLFWPT